MPNWTYSYVNVKHDKKITEKEFFDKFSTDGKTVSVPMMILGNKKSAEDFKKISRILVMPKYYEGNKDKTIREMMFHQHFFTNVSDKDIKFMKGFVKLVEKEMKEDGLNPGSVLDSFNVYTPDTLVDFVARAFSKKFGHLVGLYEMKQIMDWYETNCAVLGTKWEFELEDFEVEEDEFTFRTETAWCSPYNFLKWISKTFNTKVVATAEYEDILGMTHNCGWTEDDEDDFDDEKYEEIHYNNPDVCFEHRQGLMYVNGKEIADVVLKTEEECDNFGEGDEIWLTKCSVA